LGNVIFMERLSDSSSKPVASFTARPMTTGSIVGRRPPRPLLRGGTVGHRDSVASHLAVGDTHACAVGHRTLAVSAAGRAGREGSVRLVGNRDG
jgi:hypothetical protein